MAGSRFLSQTLTVAAASFLIVAVAGLFISGKSDLHDDTSRGDQLVSAEQLDGYVTAPDFPAGLEWLNTERPISMKDLEGKLVLLDFWTFCCINCMHVIPDLKRLEAKYPEELVVIGVHSAKFTNEKQTDAIRQAILRYEIEHPVVNDRDFETWSRYGVRAWPTLVLINPWGKIIGSHSGEGIFEPFDRIISQTIGYFDALGELDRRPLAWAPESRKVPGTLLSFPGKISADTAGGRLFITDSNHNRIIITDSDGVILDVIGSGRIGTADGGFETAEFNHPQGTFPNGNVVYVADTENHTVRAADLTTRQVTTVLGTGQQARISGIPGTGTDVALNSPWDVLVLGGKLYIAMAGPHQLWQADLRTLYAQPFAGSGREDRLDGPLLKAALAQPSGLATDGIRLYFADSETSSIRSATIGPDGRVTTLVGEALFDFGDIDGPLAQARLQHPLGVAARDGLVYVADTYNSKIKVIDPAQGRISTLAGTGTAGDADGSLTAAQFNEPGGLTFLGDRLFVADVNNHRVRVIDIAAGRVSTLDLREVGKLAGSLPGDNAIREIDIAGQGLRPGDGSIVLNISLREGHKFAAGAPRDVHWESADHAILKILGDGAAGNGDETRYPVSARVNATPGETVVTAHATIYYCRAQSSLCLYDEFRVNIPIRVSTQGAGQIVVDVTAGS